MSARENDLLRIQEIYDIATQTIAQLEELRLTREQFASIHNAAAPYRGGSDESGAQGCRGGRSSFGSVSRLRIRASRNERLAQPSGPRLRHRRSTHDMGGAPERLPEAGGRLCGLLRRSGYPSDGHMAKRGSRSGRVRIFRSATEGVAALDFQLACLRPAHGCAPLQWNGVRPL